MDDKGETNASSRHTPFHPLSRQRTPSGDAPDQGCSPLHFPHPSPSPGSKKLTGISSNARNDIYLQTLLNSPYHKGYSPEPSGRPPQSPNFKTPIRNRLESPGPGITSTPQGTNPPGCRKRFITPKNAVLNPFEGDVDDLHLPAYMSPGFFTVASTPATEEKQRAFRWSIEHIAELHPADIDEMPDQHGHIIPNKEAEARAQRAIDNFFATNLIAPSPWSEPKKNTKKKILSTPKSNLVSSTQKEELMTELEGSIQKQLPQPPGTQEGTLVCSLCPHSSCQTVLTLPFSLDINKVLGAYMTYDAHDDGNQEMLSTSSLRRKLFFHGDTSSLAPSPVKGVGDASLSEPRQEHLASPPTSKPMNPAWDTTTPHKTATPTFSSSPIKSCQTPQYRRCLSQPEFLDSPELSPIVHGNLPVGNARRSRSSGVFQPPCFNISPVNDDGSDGIPSSPMSPIPFMGTTPSSDGDDVEFRPKFAESPGFSPIRAPKTTIRKSLRQSQEESYIQDDFCTSEDEAESITPISSQPARTSRTPRTSIHDLHLSPIHKTSQQRLSYNVPKSHSLSDLEHTAMDFETVPSTRNPRFVDNIMTSSLCDTRDYSVSNMEFPDETAQRTNTTCQDTGYQTASLQSTNPEAGLHTNLTSQFLSLPFNVTNQEPALQTSSQMSANQDKATVSKLGDQLMFSTDVYDNSASLIQEQSQCNDSALPDESVNKFTHQPGMTEGEWVGEGSSPQTEDKVLSRARQALAMANSLYPKERLPGAGDYFAAQTSADMFLKTRQKTLADPKQLKESLDSPSEIAKSVLQRAGEDLAKFAPILPSQKSTGAS